MIIILMITLRYTKFVLNRKFSKILSRIREETIINSNFRSEFLYSRISQNGTFTTKPEMDKK